LPALEEHAAVPSPVPAGLERVTTARLVLRRPLDTDVAVVLALHSDPACIRYNPSEALRSAADARALIDRWQRQWGAGLGYWIVEHDGAPVGVCGVKAVELGGVPVWNLLYRLLPAAWGRGFAREAAAEAVSRAAVVDAARPVIARIRAANGGSARVAAAIGLVRRPDLDVDGEDGPDEVWAPPAPP
jgi:RimJ/RimL family protein N-acetyltransferase